MCGFAGRVGPDMLGAADRARTLARMSAYLAARGPDAETIVEDDEIGLVFRRLAIVDVAGGDQPFESEDGRHIAVVNGEIYNHRALAEAHLRDIRLATASDCEVVLHLFRKFGTGFLDLLNGIYAIAIWDRRDRRLVLARDRLGVKPLYYAPVGGALLFGSELKALLAHRQCPRALDWAAFRHVPHSRFPFDRPAGRPVATGVKGVLFVPAGAWVEWRRGEMSGPFLYWHPQGAAPDAPLGSSDEEIDRCAALLDESVRLQLMSDVPVGIALSGGVDSALLTMLAARSRCDLTAFTLAEPAITATGDTAAAVEVAALAGVDLHLVRVDREALEASAGLDLAMLERFVWLMDFPLFDIEFLFKHQLHRFAKQHDPGLKVMLLGQGADEFAGGYARLGQSEWTGYAAREAEVMRSAALAARDVPETLIPYVDPSLVEADIRARAGDHEAWQFLRFGDLPAYNLWHEDRTAAANGIEARVPYLDHRLVEFLCRIPIERRAGLFFDKALLRAVAARVMPRRLAQRPKVPLYRRSAGADDTVTALYRVLLRRAYPPFRACYLATAPLFSATALDALFDRADVPRGGEDERQLLLRCMAIAIFDRQCRLAAQDGFVPPIAAARAPVPAAATPPEPSRTAPGPHDRIELAEGVRLAVSCDRPPALLVIENGALTAQITLRSGTADDWRAAFAEGRLDPDVLARMVGADGARPLAEAFVERGWGRVAATRTGG